MDFLRGAREELLRSLLRDFRTFHVCCSLWTYATEQRVTQNVEGVTQHIYIKGGNVLTAPPAGPTEPVFGLRCRLLGKRKGPAGPFF